MYRIVKEVSKMENRSGFFEENNGNKSSTRLFSFVLLLFFCWYNSYYIIAKHCEISMDYIMFNLVLLMGIFAPKYLQKVAELRLGNVSNTEKTEKVTVVTKTEKSAEDVKQ